MCPEGLIELSLVLSAEEKGCKLPGSESKQVDYTVLPMFASVEEFLSAHQTEQKCEQIKIGIYETELRFYYIRCRWWCVLHARYKLRLVLQTSNEELSW